MLFCTDTYPPQVNGVSVVTALSVGGLRRRGWECAVIAPRYPRAEHNVFDDSGAMDQVVSLPSVPLPGYRDIRLAAPLLSVVEREIDRFGPDLVHCETEFVIGRLGQSAARRRGIPVVSSYHTDFGKYVATYGAHWLRGTVTSAIARFHRRSAMTYTPSTPARDELLRLGVPHVEVWGRGVDLHRFNPSRRMPGLRDAFGGRGRFTFLHVGRLAAEKGVECILAAYRLAAALLPENSITLVIAGTGPREKSLRAIAPHGVTFCGNLDRRRFLPSLYASCDAFLFSSVTETLGLVVLEAMASGLPVIATPAGGVADHLRDGENGIAFPANDAVALAHAMVRLAMNVPLRDRLGAGARRTAESLGWDAELDRLDVSYRAVCAAASALEIAPSETSAPRRSCARSLSRGGA